MFVIAVRNGSSLETRIVFIEAESEEEARARFYDLDQFGSVVAIERVPSRIGHSIKV